MLRSTKSLGRSRGGVLATATVAVLALVGCSASGGGSASGFPRHDITAVVTAAPGGASDVLTRLMGNDAKKDLGASFDYKYNSGGAGAAGATEIATANANGYTIGMFNAPQIALYPLVKQGDFQVNSFSYICQVAKDSDYLVTTDSSPYTSAKGLLAAAKSSPGKITVGTTSPLSGLGLASAQLQQLAGVKFSMIPFSGGSQIEAALLGNHVQAAFITSTILQQIGNSKLHVLAVADATPNAAAPQTPTFTQLGYPIVTEETRLLIGPKNIPAATLDKLRSGCAAIVTDKDFVSRSAKAGINIDYVAGATLEAQLQKTQDDSKSLLVTLGLTK